MKICNVSSRVIKFEDVIEGVVFTLPSTKEEGPFLKIEAATDVSDNAVNLVNGSLKAFHDKASVIPWPNAYLTLE